MFPRVTHPSAANPEGSARLACVRPAASVRSEPGSNSQVESAETLSLTLEPLHIVPAQAGQVTSVQQIRRCQRSRQTVKLTLSSSGRNPKEPICSVRPSKQTKPPTYLFSKSKMSKSTRQNQTGCAFTYQRVRPICLKLFRLLSASRLSAAPPPRCLVSHRRFGSAVSRVSGRGAQALFSGPVTFSSQSLVSMGFEPLFGAL